MSDKPDRTETQAPIAEVIARGYYEHSAEPAQVDWTALPRQAQQSWIDYVAAVFDAAGAAGYVIVPREPSEAMLDAGYIQLPGETFQRPKEPINAWRAMLDAAPK